MAGFIDFLAFEEATLLMAAVLIGYTGILAFLGMRRDNASAVKSTLKGAAIPIGSLGGIVTILALWQEIVWPFPAGMAAYNIFFVDIFLLFGATLVILAVSMATSSKLQFAGLFAFVAGGVTIAYGWSGYQLGMTKDPLETFLMYGAFGLSGILAFPATVITDHYLGHPDGTAFAFGTGVASPRRRPSIQASSRAVQPIVPVDSSGVPDSEKSFVAHFHLPAYISVTLLVFVAMMALAGIAALFYLDSTLPAHLASPP
jgi:putative membrane protein